VQKVEKSSLEGLAKIEGSLFLTSRFYLSSPELQRFWKKSFGTYVINMR
jgi:hypothetical protein